MKYDKRILFVGNYSSYYRSELWVSAAIEEKHNISFVTRKYYGFDSTFAKFAGYVLFNLEIAFKLCFADKVFLLPMNHNAIFMLLLLRRLLRFELVSDLYISAYDTAIDRKRIKGSFQVKYKRMLDRLIIEKSDKIVHFSITELEYISGKVGATIPKTRYHHIPLCVPERDFISPSNDEIFGVCWWGTYVPLHGIEQILEAAKCLRNSNSGSEIKFYLYGIDLPEKQLVEDFISENAMEEWIYFRTDCTFSNGKLLQELEEKCDLALGVFGVSEKAKNTVANKVIDASSMGLPVLNMYSALAEEYFGDLIFYSTTSPEDIAQSIMKLSQMNLTSIRRSLYEYSRNRYSFTQAKSIMKKILES